MTAIDLFCGLGGWTEGLLAEDWAVVGFDIERRPYPAQLVLGESRGSSARAHASAMIAKIPEPLARFVARMHRP